MPNSVGTLMMLNMIGCLQPSDDEERIKEALTRAVVMAMLAPSGDQLTWLNPTEVQEPYQCLI